MLRGWLLPLCCPGTISPSGQTDGQQRLATTNISQAGKWSRHQPVLTKELFNDLEVSKEGVAKINTGVFQ